MWLPLNGISFSIAHQELSRYVKKSMPEGVGCPACFMGEGGVRLGMYARRMIEVAVVPCLPRSFGASNMYLTRIMHRGWRV